MDVFIDNITKPEDMLTMAGILVAAGYTVEIAKYHPSAKSGAYKYYVKGTKGAK